MLSALAVLSFSLFAAAQPVQPSVTQGVACLPAVMNVAVQILEAAARDGYVALDRNDAHVDLADELAHVTAIQAADIHKNSYLITYSNGFGASEYFRTSISEWNYETCDFENERAREQALSNIQFNVYNRP